MTDSAGVQIVTNSAPAWDAGSPWTVDTIPLVSIGGRSDDSAQQFKYIVGARRLADGRVVVATDKDVRWFRADGKLQYVNARNGDGPGEFRFRYSIARMPGDTVVVADGFGSRVSTFSPAGVLVRDERVDRQRLAALGRWAECYSGLLPDGTRFSCAGDVSIPLSATNRPNRMTAAGWSSPGAGLLRQLRRTYLISPSLDTAYRLGIVAGIEQYGFQPSTGAIVFFQHPFYSHSLLTAGGSPMRIATVLNPEYRVELWTPDGRLERVVRRTRARRVPTVDELRLAGEEVRESERRRDPVTLEAALAATPLPDSLPAASWVVISELGDLFVARDLMISATASFDVFERTGRWLGTLQLPARTRLIDAGLDYLLVLRVDVDDLPSVQLLRLHRGT